MLTSEVPALMRICASQSIVMNKINVAVLFVTLLIIGAYAEPRKMLADTEEAKLAGAHEHQRILAELEEVHALRERMLQEGENLLSSLL